MAAVAPATSSPSSPPAAPGTRDLELLAGPLAQPGIADDLLDLVGVDARAIDDGLLHEAEKVGGMESGQSTVLATDRGADGIDEND